MWSEVPRGWDTSSLGEVAAVSLSGVDKKSKTGEREVSLCNYMDVYQNSEISAQLQFMAATATDAEIERFRLRVGDVMITKDSEDPTDIAVPAVVVEDLPGLVLCGYHLALLRPHSIEPGFLAWALRSRDVNNQFVQRANGATRFGLTLKVISDAGLLLPPLPEQKEIAAILSSVDEAIQATQAVIDQTQRVKEGLLQDLLTKGIGHTRSKQTEGWTIGRLPELGQIPETWEIMPIASVARLESGHTPSRQVPGYWGGDVQWLSLHDTGNMAHSHITRTALTITEAGLANSSARMLPEGTVALSRTATIGKCVILGASMATSQDFACYVCGPRLLNRYLLHLFRYMQHVWKALSGGSTHKTVYMPAFRRLEIVLPPLEEQAKIADIMDHLDAAVLDAAPRLASLQTLKAGLLQDLLTGTVRVSV